MQSSTDPLPENLDSVHPAVFEGATDCRLQTFAVTSVGLRGMADKVFGLVGDSSLYLKNSKKKVHIHENISKQQGGRVWCKPLPDGGVSEICRAIRRGPDCGVLGISYFGNDIVEGRIRQSVELTWLELIDYVRERQMQVVFLVGGCSECLSTQIGWTFFCSSCGCSESMAVKEVPNEPHGVRLHPPV